MPMVVTDHGLVTKDVISTFMLIAVTPVAASVCAVDKNGVKTVDEGVEVACDVSVLEDEAEDKDALVVSSVVDTPVLLMNCVDGVEEKREDAADVED